ncbi:LexA family protein [Gorillibacterium sp. sgz5001074]|uniref:LexA family protein n=1 Tax=Gorillibacterium sp. sgz5001074 TaxID=3446695 RepID=UPI003F66C67F
MERLTDIERKMLNILRNYNTMNYKMPTMFLLRAKTGRNDAGVEKLLIALAKKGYIDWAPGTPLSKIGIIRGFEPKWDNWWSKYK